MTQLNNDIISLLQLLVQTRSYSGEESQTADHIQHWLAQRGITTSRLHNNVIAKNLHYQDDLPTVILNSHHDTVLIGEGWTKDPLGAHIDGDRLYGRGSNDAGGSLVALIGTFTSLYKAELPYNLVLIASAEEENFGPLGVSSVLEEYGLQPDLGIIGEPTEMHLAIAEKGLIVIDATTKGVSGHAARDVGTNALYLACEDIQRIRDHQWSKTSDVLGATKTTVTQIQSGHQHNVIPDDCSYVIDCRVNENYSLHEVLRQLEGMTHATLTPRSLKWSPSGINPDHPIVKQGQMLGRRLFGSPTLSDQVHFSCPTIKVGPGKSERSHTIDEFIYVNEVMEAVQIYRELLIGLDLG